MSSGLGTAQHHISLNGSGFILVDESYRKKAQQPFSPRFATGDPSEGDNSFWQFLSQKGWTGEGQEKFDIVTKYRQSAGWNIRDGKPHIGFGLESVTLANALVDPYTLIAAYLLENFATGSVDWAKWNYGGPFGNAGAIAAQAGAYGARTGYLATYTTSVLISQQNFGGAYWTYSGSYDTIHGVVPSTGGGGYAPTWYPTAPTYQTSEPAIANIPARGTSLSLTETYQHYWGSQNWGGHTGGSDLSNSFRDTYQVSTRVQQIYQMGKTGLSLQSIGDWAHDVYIRNTVNQIHSAWGFMMNTAGGGYVIEISGSGATTAKLYKTPGTTCWDTTGNTLLKTWTLAGSSSNTKTEIKVRVTAGNVFSLYQDGALVAGGTVTDTTYTTGDATLFTTAYSASGDTTLSNFNIPASAGSASGITGKFVHYNNKLYLAYKANGVSDFTFTNTVTASINQNLPGITHINVADAAVWHRDADPTGFSNSVTAKSALLATVAGNVLNVYSGTTLVYTDGLAGVGAMVVPINSTTILVFGMTAENSGIPFMQRFKFTANTNTLSTEKIVHIDGGVFGTIVNSFAFDADGMLYAATVDISGTEGSMPCRIIRISAADLLATELCLTAVDTISDFTVRALSAFNGKVYLFGAWLEGGKAYNGIARFPGTQVYRSTKGVQLAGGTTGALFNYGIATIWPSNRSVRFLSNTDLDIWDPVLELDVDENVREVASFNSGQLDTDDPNVIAICEWNGRFYCLNAAAGTLVRTTAVRGGLGASFATCVLQMSDMGGNTSLISKTLRSVIVELSEAMPADEELTVIVNGTTVGTMTDTDGTRKEIALSAELTSAVFTTKLSLLQSSTWTGYPKAVMLKYVPTQFKKKAWALGIRTTRNLRLLDGKGETRSAAVILAALWTAWASNIPVVFIDKDRVSYNVLITDIDERVPVMPSNIDDLEALAFIEVLEAD